MAGYNERSMSNNAIKAYENGEKPISRWTKQEVLACVSKQIENGAVPSFTVPLESLPWSVIQKLFLYQTGWHHTGVGYNETAFYAFADLRIHTLSDEYIKRLLQRTRSAKLQKKRELEVIKYAVMRCFSKENGKKTFKIEPGVVKGAWFYGLSGRKRKQSKNVIGCPSFNKWGFLIKKFPIFEKDEEAVNLIWKEVESGS